MKRALILLLFMFIGNSSGFCATNPFFTPLTPIGQNQLQAYNDNITSLPDQFVSPDKFVNNSSINYSNITQIENSLFGRNFANQSISQRLSRIENTMFTTTYPNSPDAQRIDNIISNFNQINKYPNISKNVLSRIESKVFNQNFSTNSPQRRIERLEQQIFGAVQSGDMTARYQAIQMAAKNYGKNTETYEDDFASTGSTKNTWKSIAGNIGGNLLGGYMTGFTPPISPYTNYNNYNRYSTYANPYSNPYSGNSGIYRGVRVNNGLGGYRYQDAFTNYGSGTGVTILD